MKLYKSWIINFFESNLGQESAHMAHMVKNERKVWTMYEKGKAGVVTTNERKMKYVLLHLPFTCLCIISFQTEPMKIKQGSFQGELIYHTWLLNVLNYLIYSKEKEH